MKACQLSLLCIGMTLVLDITNACQAQNKPLDARVVKVLSDWEKRQNKVPSVRYVVKGEVVIPKGSNTDDFGNPLVPASPARDISSPWNETLLADFLTGRFRMEVSRQSFGSQGQQSHPIVNNVAFNGTVIKYASPREANTNSIYSPAPDDPDVGVYSGNLAGFKFEPQYYPLFFAHGIVPTAEQQIVAGRFKKKLDAGYFQIKGTGMHAGRRCLVMRTETLQLANSTFDEYWIDEGRESAVLRSTSFAANQPYMDTDIEYRKTPNGWLPKSWTFTSFLRGKTHRVWRMKVDELSLEPAFGDADFDIEIKPGMRVREIHFPDSPNPLYVPEAAATEFIQGENQIGVALFSSTGLRSKWVWIVVSLSLVAALLTYMLYSRRKARG